ncbi:hypothetical protein L3Q82_006032 [Scortum barcoo]|uniref:Uncharacterized protein n=1 Tax=Scortum barcoo TaxID=214431 RepID=A0ACB8X2E8_9TELE|nr:hypothetical protein L3Q82_006032 [Scortum barcoo]
MFASVSDLSSPPSSSSSLQGKSQIREAEEEVDPQAADSLLLTTKPSTPEQQNVLCYAECGRTAVITASFRPEKLWMTDYIDFMWTRLQLESPQTFVSEDDVQTGGICPETAAEP